MSLNWSFIEQGDVRAAIFEDYPHLNENFNDQINEYIKLLENKSKDEIEITPKDTRTAKEKKSDTLNENIKDFEEMYVWSPVDERILKFYQTMGLVKNIQDIKPPVRLFFYPYLQFLQLNFEKKYNLGSLLKLYLLPHYQHHCREH